MLLGTTFIVEYVLSILLSSRKTVLVTAFVQTNYQGALSAIAEMIYKGTKIVSTKNLYRKYDELKMDKSSCILVHYAMQIGIELSSLTFKIDNGNRKENLHSCSRSTSLILERLAADRNLEAFPDFPVYIMVVNMLSKPTLKQHNTVRRHNGDTSTTVKAEEIHLRMNCHS